MEIRYLLLGAKFYSFSDQCVIRCLVTVGDHRNYMHQASRSALRCHFDEANQFAFPECADEIASINKCGQARFDSLIVLTIVPKRFALSQRGLVVDRLHASHKLIVEGHLVNFHAFLLRFSDMVPSMGANLVLPPLLVRGYSEYGKTFQFAMKRVMRLLVADWLHETEQVRPVLFPPEFCDESF